MDFGKMFLTFDSAGVNINLNGNRVLDCLECRNLDRRILEYLDRMNKDCIILDVCYIWTPYANLDRKYLFYASQTDMCASRT